MSFVFSLGRRFLSTSSKMVKVLNVAEKNDAAKSIADALTRGGFSRREGYSRFNKIYEFEYMLMNQRCNMVMTSVSGHLLGMEFVGNFRKWSSCSPVSLFDVPIEKYCPQNFIDIKRTLEREVRGAQMLVIWTDCDREGENIGFEVIQVCKAVKPNIKVYRAKFSEITNQGIARACQNLSAPDKNTSDAVDVRSELDLRIGAAFTRFQTMRLQKIFPGVLAEQLISYGSCQFPTLGFVVERYKQVQAFIAEPFWKIKVQNKMEEATVDFNWKRNKLFDYMACFILYQHCLESPIARVVDTQGRSKSKWRPQALDTVELEKLASRKLRINAKETMKIAEKLYTSGFISYPRTETNMFTKEIDLASLVEHQTRDQNWGAFATQVLERGPTPRNGKKTDNAHPPIHPTKYTDSLQGNEKKVYEFIVRHFLACCSQDAQGYETTVEIALADERFTSHGLMVTAKNYLEVYIYEKWSDKEMPVFEKGDEFEPTSLEMVDGETSPPPLLTEADLIALMDKHGIGTDATHAEHIETIKSRNYVGVRPDGRLVPGQLGMGLVEGYDAMGYEMSKPHLRAELEADLKSVCLGTKQKDVVLETQVRKYKEVFIEAVRQAQKIDEALSHYLEEAAQPLADGEAVMNLDSLGPPVMKCPQCGQDMLMKTKKDNNGFYVGCLGFPNCKCAIWFPQGVTEASVSPDSCSRCGPNVHLVIFKFKRGSVPPTVPLEYTGCIAGCDDTLVTEVGIRAPPRNAQPTGPARPNTASLPSQQRGSGRAGQNSTRNMSTSASSQHNTNVTSANNRNPSQQQLRVNNVQNRNTSLNSTGSSGYQSNFASQNDSFGHSQSFNRGGNSSFGTTETQRGGNPRVPLANVSSNSRMMDSGIDDSGENAVVCNCGNDAVQLTVRKEGPNTGRQFYKCAGSTCTFFLWADEAGDPGDRSGDTKGTQNKNRSVSSSYSSNRDRPPSYVQSRDSGAGNDVVCGCGQPAKSLTVQKEGPNKGRPFHACPAPRGEGCNFFQWGDEVPPPDGGFRGAGRGSGGPGGGAVSWAGGGGAKKRPATSDGGGPPKRAKKCGLCGVEGHTKRTCPHK